MLNVAVAKVNLAERELAVTEAEHQAKMLSVAEMDTQLKHLSKEFKGSIKKSKLVLISCPLVGKREYPENFIGIRRIGVWKPNAPELIWFL